MGDLWIASNLLLTKEDSSYVAALVVDTSRSFSTAKKARTPALSLLVSDWAPMMPISSAHTTSMYLVTPLAETSALNRICKGAMRNQRGRDNKLKKLNQSASGSNLRPTVRDLTLKLRSSDRESRRKPPPKPSVYASK